VRVLFGRLTGVVAVKRNELFLLAQLMRSKVWFCHSKIILEERMASNSVKDFCYVIFPSYGSTKKAMKREVETTT